MFFLLPLSPCDVIVDLPLIPLGEFIPGRCAHGRYGRMVADIAAAVRRLEAPAVEQVGHHAAPVRVVGLLGQCAYKTASVNNQTKTVLRRDQKGTGSRIRNTAKT
jgi:hypothetical protein